MGIGQRAPTGPHDYQQVSAFRPASKPKAFSNLPLDAIANHGWTDFSPHGQAEPGPSYVVRSDMDDEHGTRGPPTSLGSTKLARPQQAGALREALRPPFTHFLKMLTESRLRPLARRADKTLRPFLVCMRLRNPCLRTRRRFEGWNVRFIDSSGGTRSCLAPLGLSS